MSNGEWIYTGASNDYRASTGATADSDVTQVRVTNDDTYVYFHVTMQNIAGATIPAVGIALNTNRSTTAGRGHGWIGEASTPTDSLGLGNAVQNAEKELMFYVRARLASHRPLGRRHLARPGVGRFLYRHQHGQQYSGNPY